MALCFSYYAKKGLLASYKITYVFFWYVYNFTFFRPQFLILLEFIWMHFEVGFKFLCIQNG